MDLEKNQEIKYLNKILDKNLLNNHYKQNISKKIYKLIKIYFLRMEDFKNNFIIFYQQDMEDLVQFLKVKEFSRIKFMQLKLLN